MALVYNPFTGTLDFTSGGGGGGTVTSIATTSPISGGTITTTGTLSLLTNVDFAFTQTQTITTAPAANTSTDGLILTDTTAATSGNQQYSPRLRLTGQGWETSGGASQTADWIVENQPVQGSAHPTTNLVFSSQVNAGGYSAIVKFLSSGSISVPTLSNNSTNPIIGGNNTGSWMYDYFGLLVSTLYWMSASGFTVGGTKNISFESTSNVVNNSPDVYMWRDGPNVLAHRNGTTAQAINLYNTSTTALTACEYFTIDWKTTSNTVNLQAVAGSTSGTARPLTISYGGKLASPTAAITVPITSGSVSIAGVAVSADGGGIASTVGHTNVTNTTVTNAYVVAGGQAATTMNTGWMKVYIGTTVAWVPYWANATP